MRLPCKGYWENGNLKEKEFYRNGKKEGEWFWYWENGSLEERGAYKNSVREGIWITYNKDGSIDQKAIFKNGRTNDDYPVWD